MHKSNLKFLATVLIIFLHASTVKIFTSNAAIPLSTPFSMDNQKKVQGLLDNISPNPAVMIDPITHQLVQIPQNRFSRFMLPANTTSMVQKTNMSILRPVDMTLYKNYPAGTTLFPKNNDIAVQFDDVIKAIQGNNEFIKFFRKIHLNCLNQLYLYLMRVYTNVMIQSNGCSRSAHGDLELDMVTFIHDEKEYAINEKMLIISFLVNLIESQFHQMILSFAPKIPSIFATPTGKTLIQNDFSVDLTSFSLPADDQVIQQIQTTYNIFLHTYIHFFKVYTDLLFKQDKASGYTQFAMIAQNLSTNKAVIAMNPPIFFYDNESIRAIKMIPYLASQLPKKTSSIGWAPDAVTAAIKGIMRNGHPVAYFKDSTNQIVKDKSQATSLYLISMSGDNMFEEELVAQPDWLNSSQGIINILKACLGDFSQLISLNILDPFTQAILERAMNNGVIDPTTLKTITDFAATMKSAHLQPSDKNQVASASSSV